MCGSDQPNRLRLHQISHKAFTGMVSHELSSAHNTFLYRDLSIYSQDISMKKIIRQYLYCLPSRLPEPCQAPFSQVCDSFSVKP